MKTESFGSLFFVATNYYSPYVLFFGSRMSYQSVERHGERISNKNALKNIQLVFERFNCIAVDISPLEALL
jgi:hypothetical protein